MRGPGSAYYGKIDPAKLAVAGFSCGGGQAMDLGSDPRVKTVIMQNSGMFPDDANFLPGLGGQQGDAENRYARRSSTFWADRRTFAYKNGIDDFSRIDRVPGGGGRNELQSWRAISSGPTAGRRAHAGGDVARMGSCAATRKPRPIHRARLRHLQRPAVDGAEEEPPPAQVTGPEKRTARSSV